MFPYIPGNVRATPQTLRQVDGQHPDERPERPYAQSPWLPGSSGGAKAAKVVERQGHGYARPVEPGQTHWTCQVGRGRSDRATSNGKN